MNKKTIVLGAAVMLLLSLAGCKSQDYQLMWVENFSGHKLDTTKWEKINRYNGHWCRYHSKRDEVCYLKDGKLVLLGINNTIDPADTARYLTGAVQTKGDFKLGKIEVRAKLGHAKGAWPAFWMLPGKNRTYAPDGAEIDIMEHLNYDSIFHQTVHSYYTLVLKHEEEPPHHAEVPFKVGKYNVFAVEVTPDSVVYSVNGKHTFTYPRLANAPAAGQYPFADDPYFLMLDMQLSGDWVGPIDPATLPVKVEVDWVKYWKRKP